AESQLKEVVIEKNQTLIASGSWGEMGSETLNFSKNIKIRFNGTRLNFHCCQSFHLNQSL
ncbi:MAG: hypothetical protein L0Z73_14005, partial [Gammaproteobacteria bacterium]|nr:hypothetical protein [Gammaproteobacteria bacterium]